jgi:hypothetical protein
MKTFVHKKSSALTTLCTAMVGVSISLLARLGPGPRAVLQKLIDALIAIPEFNVEVARGQTKLFPSTSSKTDM